MIEKNFLSKSPLLKVGYFKIIFTHYKFDYYQCLPGAQPALKKGS